MSYRTSGGMPRLAQSSHHNWLHADNPKPVREPNRNGRVKTIKPRKPRKKNTSMVNMADILSQLNGAVATEVDDSDEIAEVVEVDEVVEESTKTETVIIASGTISIARKKRGNKVIPVLQIELDKDMLKKLGITI